MKNLQHRHDITDEAWAIIEPLLPGQKGQWEGIAKDNRKFINAVFWILRTGELLGEIYRRLMESGALFISVSAVGEKKEYGKKF